MSRIRFHNAGHGAVSGKQVLMTQLSGNVPISWKLPIGFTFPDVLSGAYAGIRKRQSLVNGFTSPAGTGKLGRHSGFASGGRSGAGFLDALAGPVRDHVGPACAPVRAV